MMPEHVETSPSTTIGPDRAAPRDQTFLIAAVVACVVVIAGWAAYSLAPRWPPAPIDPLPTGSLFVGPSQINHHALAFFHVADTSRQKLAYRVMLLTLGLALAMIGSWPRGVLSMGRRRVARPLSLVLLACAIWCWAACVRPTTGRAPALIGLGIVGAVVGRLEGATGLDQSGTGDPGRRAGFGLDAAGPVGPNRPLQPSLVGR